MLDLPEALEGFSSSSILTVMGTRALPRPLPRRRQHDLTSGCHAVLLGMAEGISQTGALDSFFQRVLGRPSTPTAAIIRMALPVCFWSSFLNNTPIVGERKGNGLCQPRSRSRVGAGDGAGALLLLPSCPCAVSPLRSQRS